MCRLNYNYLRLVFYFVLISPCFCWARSCDEPYSRREAVQEHIDECIGIVYKIRSNELEQEEGLEYLEDMLDLLKFITWYWIDDSSIYQEKSDQKIHHVNPLYIQQN